MYAPVEWLRDLVHVDPEATGADIAAHLVRVGLEEEDLHGGDVKGPLVVGRVLERTPEKQKNGKTINWCQVDVGQANGTGQPQGIVCGAHNFEAGDLVAVILPGGVLGGDFTIAERKTYGHVSAGMICSARELGVGEDHDGIIVLTDWFHERPDALAALTPGADLIPLFGLDRETVEVNVTPDRGYCFSMRGIAREYALSTGVPFTDPGALDARAVAEANEAGHEVRLADDAPLLGRAGCDRYVARIVRGVDVSAASPVWMQDRLTASGMRPISLAVDVTNYVMLLLGQPLHAFDLDRLEGAIEVRRARPGERLTTLDDVERQLDPEDLLITDDGRTVLAIAGVMGGASSEVTDTTTNVLIEAAHFDPTTVARSARRHRLATEASKRFERGVDPAITAVAAQLAVDLLVEHGGGTVDPGVTDTGTPTHPAAFAFDTTLPTRLVGLEYTRAEVLSTLEAIGCSITPGEGDVVTVQPASWRPDLQDGPDLVEEVARVRGYDEIPSVVPFHEGRGLTHGQLVRRAVAATLAHHGLTEVLSYPFVAPEVFDHLGYASDDARRRTVRLANPLQDEAPLMRTSLLDTLLETLRRNVSRGMRDVAVFEAGLVTRGDNPVTAPTPPLDGRPDAATLDSILAAVPAQPHHVAFAAAGEVTPPSAVAAARPYDTYDVIEWSREIGRVLGAPLQVRAATLAPWHPGRCAEFHLPDGTVVGYAGELHPKVVSALGLPARTVAAELDLDVLIAATGTPTQATALSTYPAANTDIALVVDESMPAAQVEAAVRSGAGPDLESLTLFDIYRGDQVGEARKSLAYRLTFRSSAKTLTTNEVSALRDKAVAAAAKATGASQRA